MVIPRDALLSSAALTGGIQAVLALDDREANTGPDFEADWQGFWGVTNLLQFLPDFRMITARGVAGERYAPAEPKPQEGARTREGAAEAGAAPAEAVSSEASDWKELATYSLFGDEVRVLRDRDIRPPQLGHEMQRDDGEVIIELELAWVDARVGVIHPDFAPEAEAADDSEAIQGWSLYVGLGEDVVEALAGHLALKGREDTA